MTDPKEKRIPKDDVLSSRRDFNSAEKRSATAKKKLKEIDKELERRSISTTRRKILQGERLVWLSKRDEAQVDLSLSSQKLNTFLDKNRSIDSAKRLKDRKEMNLNKRISKMSFVLQSSFKEASLPEETEKTIVEAIENQDSALFHSVMKAEVEQSKIRVTLQEGNDEVTTAVLLRMMRWFQGRLNVKPRENAGLASGDEPEVSPVRS